MIADMRERNKTSPSRVTRHCRRNKLKHTERLGSRLTHFLKQVCNQQNSRSELVRIVQSATAPFLAWLYKRPKKQPYLLAYAYLDLFMRNNQGSQLLQSIDAWLNPLCI